MAEEYTVNFNLVQDAARTAALQTAGGQVAGAGAIGGQSPQPVSYTHLTLPTTPYV